MCEECEECEMCEECVSMGAFKCEHMHGSVGVCKIGCM